MRLSEQIEEIVKRTEILRQQCENSDKEHGIIHPIDGIKEFNFGDKKQFKAVMAQEPFYDEFIKYLMSIDESTLLKIEALMYSGRDNTSYKVSYDHCRRTLRQSHTRIADKLREKSGNLQSYLLKAVSALKQEGIDIDSL